MAITFDDILVLLILLFIATIIYMKIRNIGLREFFYEVKDIVIDVKSGVEDI